MVCLVVSSDEDRNTWISEINACDDFSTDDLETQYSQPSWVYSMCLADSDEVYLAHSGKVLRRGPIDAPEVVLTHDRDVTRLCAAAQGVYLVGLEGYVGHYDGSGLHDRSIPDAEVFHVAESADGSLYAAANRGRVFRRSEGAWHPIQVAPDGDIRHLAVDGDAMLYAGAAGMCGQIRGEAVTQFAAPAARDFFAVARFQGRVFVGAGRDGLDVLDGDSIVSFKANVYSYKLWADDDHLFASGMNEAARFDGTAWLASEFTH